MALTLFGSPNCALFTIVFHELNVTWFNTFVASTFRSRLNRSPQGNVLPNVAFKPNCDGPVIEFRPAFPQWPVVGMLKADGFKNSPGGAACIEEPVASGRKLPVTPVPGTAEK